MQVTVDFKEILIIILLIALIVFVVYMTVMIANLIKTLKKTNLALDDAKIITEIAAKKTEQLDGLLDEANGVALDVVHTFRNNMSTVEKVKSLGFAASSVKGVVNKFKGGDTEDGYVKRTKVKRNKK